MPDETAQVPRERYLNPRPAAWPEADFVVGNPPFIGDKKLRLALGDGYVDALRASWNDVPESTEFVMYWWHHAANLARAGKLRRFGFITTNSLRQIFNRRIIESHFSSEPPLSLVFAVPDHPWVDAADGAAVRIAMTVGEAGRTHGRLVTVKKEAVISDDAVSVELAERSGFINADLTLGANVAGSVALRSNGGISSNGFMLSGSGFIVPKESVADVQPCDRLRPYRNGRDLTDCPRGVFLLDFCGLSAEETRQQYPAAFQWVLERVKPERDHNNRARLKAQWWLFAECRKTLRAALKGTSRLIATVETAKHRIFQFLDAEIAPDHKIIAFAIDDAFCLGVLSSQVHVTWALAAGSTLEDRPVYPKTTCFEKFPFPSATPEQQARIRSLVY